MNDVIDFAKIWKPRWCIERYEGPTDLVIAGLIEPYDVSEWEGNVALRVGKAELWNCLIGGSASHFDNTNARLGVGDTAAPAAVDTQTDLQAPTNKLYKACDSGYPQRAMTVWTNDTLVSKATFATTEANYLWTEFVLKQNTSGICMNRVVSNQGTKTNAQTWVLTLNIQWA